jgi:hypothetical protein
MIRELRIAMVVFLLLTVVTGVVYPGLVTLVAAVAFPGQAGGSQAATGLGGEVGMVERQHGSLLAQGVGPPLFERFEESVAGGDIAAFDERLVVVLELHRPPAGERWGSPRYSGDSTTRRRRLPTTSAPA